MFIFIARKNRTNIRCHIIKHLPSQMEINLTVFVDVYNIILLPRHIIDDAV